MEDLGLALSGFGILGFLISLVILIIALIRKKKRKLWLLSLIAFLILIFIGAGISPTTEEKNESEEPPQIAETEKEESTTTAPTKESVQKPIVTEKEVAAIEYVILKEDVVDSPAKTQVALEALVSGEISEPSLRTLLDQLYSSASAKKGFKYHKSPTNIYIYLYTSEERAESGMGQWIAMLQKAPSATDPTISINERQIAQIGAEPEERFGLSEEERKEIWKELVLIEDRAMEEAIERYPQDLEKQIEMERRLIDEGKNRLAEENGLTQEEIKEISAEGHEKDWPFPRMS